MNYSTELPGLIFITCEDKELSHEEQVSIAVSAGARMVQLRMKGHSYENWKGVAKEAVQLCHSANASLIINDNVAIATESGADGVHLGKQDMDPVKARELLGPGRIIGGTANTFEDILRLNNSGVQYIGLGPYRFTTTKQQLDPVLGMDGVISILNACRDHKIDIPVYVVGGIKKEDVKEIMSAGAYGVAVSSAIIRDAIPGQAVGEFIDEIKKHSKWNH